MDFFNMVYEFGRGHILGPGSLHLERTGIGLAGYDFKDGVRIESAANGCALQSGFTTATIVYAHFFKNCGGGGL
jgi:hypothetical protein